MSRFLSSVSVLLGLMLSACGPSAAERAAQERARLELEEKARLEAEAANKAITDMNRKRFGKRRPEEQAQHEAERARQVEVLKEAQKKADAEAKPNP